MGGKGTMTVAKNEALRTDFFSTPLPREAVEGFEIVELLFFAYRDFIADPDAILDKIGFGRAHHRVVHFVGSRPGMSVADLLDTLRITKQSLARVLKQLIDGGYVRQAAGPEDRRQRRLFLTQKGETLRQELISPQLCRISKAFDHLSADERATVKTFLTEMCDGDPEAMKGALSATRPHDG
ncbi:MarR family winged helix-turn-helix transcriptional regulator [Martelella endophytica]|uniref:MarR family winged helix-turn-helix transcriptional regulator n=1 Tax=Martelella endophytica TaxID=1486262 RepID=UPI000B2744A1|nr:MarR family transcriptional regulator [Martelella endophytica]